MKKLAKKVITLALTCALTVSMGMVAFAAESPKAETPSPVAGRPSPDAGRPSPDAGKPSPEAGDGEETIKIIPPFAADTIVIGDKAYPVKVTEPSQAVRDELSSQEKVISLLKSDYIAGAKVSVIGLREVSVDGIPAEVLAKGVSVTFHVDDVKSGDTIRILHKRSSDNQWEVIEPSSVEDGKITAEFTSFSPVAIVKLEGGNIAQNDQNSSNGNADTTAPNAASSQKSPKTGVNSSVYLAEAVLAVSLLGVAVLSRRKIRL